MSTPATERIATKHLALRPTGQRLLAIFGLSFLAVTLSLAWAWWRYPLPDQRSVPAVHLLAGTEELAVFQGGVRRSQVWLPLERIPKVVVDAVLAAEDRRFFQHSGIDLLACLRAAAANLRRAVLVQGGSTITQQLARMVYLDNRRTWARKLREAGIALVFELRYSKPRILEAYLNSVYMGHHRRVPVYGVAAAARDVLGKDLKAVRIEDAALLAAAIRAPNRILAGDASQALLARNAVIRAMSEQGLVRDAAAHQARARRIRRQTLRPGAEAGYFVDFTWREILRRVALPLSGAVSIHTSLDPWLQQFAAAVIGEGLERLERQHEALRPGMLQAALIAIEPASGRIRALVGGRRYAGSQFNRATNAARQAGSLFKPIVYLAAFEAGRAGANAPLTPASLIADAPLAIRAASGVWFPRNMDRRFQGPVTLRRALEESLNVPAARIAYDVGPKRVARAARALGISSPLAPVPSLALGTSAVTLLEITAAFATIANGGTRVLPTTLDVDSDSKPIPAAIPGPPVSRVVSPQSAFLITHLLRGVMRHGTGRGSARWGLSEVTAGKTGTTDGLRDAWFVGYTPDLAIGVWVGADDGRSIGLTGAQAALPIWGAVMQAFLRRTQPRPFTPPTGIVMTAIERDTGRLASTLCGGGPVIIEAFRAGTEPTSPDCEPVRGATEWFKNIFR